MNHLRDMFAENGRQALEVIQARFKAVRNKIIFTKKVTLDARQHLAVQRFTKFKDNEDKACFLFHGVGTGKTLTSLAIALSNLTVENKYNPFKILIIAI